MPKADFIKECISLATRSIFAALALFALTFGSTLRLVIDGDQTLMPGLPFTFAEVGAVASAAIFLIALFAAWISYWLFRQLGRLVVEEDQT